MGELVEWTEDDLLSVRNLGATSIAEIKEALDGHGLRLKGDVSLSNFASEEVLDGIGQNMDGDILTLPVSALGLGVRAMNCLRKAAICTIEDLIQTPEWRLIKLKNMGGTTVDQIKRKLEKRGLKLESEGRSLSKDLPSFLEDFPGTEMEWKDIPLKLSARVENFLNSFDLKTLKQLDTVAMTGGFIYEKTDERLDALQQPNFGETSLALIRKELGCLNEVGLERYRYGEEGRPRNVAALFTVILGSIDATSQEVLLLRWGGGTLENVGEKLKLTRERIRQIEAKAYDKCKYRFRGIALELLTPLTERLESESAVSLASACEVVGAESSEQLKAVIKVSDLGIHFKDPLTKFSNREIELLYKLFLHLVQQRVSIAKLDGEVGLKELVASVRPINYKISNRPAVIGQELHVLSKCQDLVGQQDYSINGPIIRRLLGEAKTLDLLLNQFIHAGSNGLSFEDIQPAGAFQTPEELRGFLGGRIEFDSEGVFRKANKMNAYARELVGFIQRQTGAVSFHEIALCLNNKLPQPTVVARLSECYETIQTAPGEYIHIEHLGLTRKDVISVAEWGFSQLKGNTSTVSAGALLGLYRDSGLSIEVENEFEMASFVSKHSEITRIASLNLAHRASLDGATIFLASTDPEIAGEFHPEKNGDLTPETVRPASNSLYWWMCSKGHEWQATAASRTRADGGCPGCQERWTVAKIRLFLNSLFEHLIPLTASELFLLFEQNGLLFTKGKSRNFVNAIATDRFPLAELNKFLNCQGSLVDQFLDDRDLTLEAVNVFEYENIDQDSEPIQEDSGESDVVYEEDTLQNCEPDKALRVFDNPDIAELEGAAMEFFRGSALVKIWDQAYLDESGVLQIVEDFDGGYQAESVRDELLEEYRTVRELQSPEGCVVELNLLQKHIAAKVSNLGRVGDCLDSNEDKTAAAILASGVIGAGLTVVCCPESVVDGDNLCWTTAIERIRPGSEVIIYSLTRVWTSASAHRYLVRSYDQLEAPDTESALRGFLESNKVDFVVIDEPKHVEGDGSDWGQRLSRRQRNLMSLVSSGAQASSGSRVLVMAETRTIDSLEDGLDLIKLVTGEEKAELDDSSTLSNRLRLHQEFLAVGARWTPNYQPRDMGPNAKFDAAEYFL